MTESVREGSDNMRRRSSTFFGRPSSTSSTATERSSPHSFSGESDGDQSPHLSSPVGPFNSVADQYEIHFDKGLIPKQLSCSFEEEMGLQVVQFERFNIFLEKQLSWGA